MGASTTVLHRLINELDVTELKELDQYHVLSTKYSIIYHTVFGYCSIKINNVEKCVANICFSNSEYKLSGRDVDKKKFELSFKYNDEIVLKNENKTLHKLYTIWIRNENLFRVKNFIALQDLQINMTQDLSTNIFYNNLAIVNDYMVSLTHTEKIGKAYQNQLLECKYTLVINSKQQQITEPNMHMDNCIYTFTNINKMQLLIPFTTNLSAIGLYVQPKDKLDFVLFKRFYPKYSSKTNITQYLLTILQVWPYPITSPTVFFKQIGFQWSDMLIPTIKKSLMKYDEKDTTKLILNRFLNELNVNEFPNLSLDHINMYTLRQLTCILTHERATTVNKTTDALLLCYVLFSNNIELLEILVERFHTTNKYAVKSKVCLLLIEWIQTFWEYDFIALPLDTVRKLDMIFLPTENIENKEMDMVMTKPKHVYQLQYNKHKQLQQGIIQRTLHEHSGGVDMKQLYQDIIATIKPVILAEQFTLIHFKAFKAIPKREILGKLSGKFDDELAMPNILNMQKLFEQTIKWVKAFILNETNFKKRTKKVKLCIYAVTFMQNVHRNFTGFCAFVKALTSEHIIKLKNWDKLSKSDTKKFENMLSLFVDNKSLRELKSKSHTQ
eukprot:459380_1